MTTAAPPASSPPLTSRHAGVVLAVLCAAQLMLIVDVVVVNVALRAIRDGLAVPDSQLQLTGIAYTLVFGSLLVVGARVGDAVGRRRLLLTGLALFVLASALTGSAQTAWQLFGGRALQGLAAAVVSPNALALLTATIPEGERRNRALGVWAAVGSAGAIAGQLVGGLLTELAGWRWVFLVNVPIGLATLAVARRVLPESRVSDARRVDVVGAVTLAGGLAALTVALTRVAEGAAGTATAAAAGLAVALAATFVVVERRHPAPLVRFALLRARTVRVANLALALNAGALGGALFLTSLYLQVVLDWSALAVGAAFAPVTLVVLVVSPWAGRLVGRFGARALLVPGLALVAAGMALLAQVPLEGSYAANVLPGLALLALGSGLAYAPTFVAGTWGIAPDDQGLASGLLGTAQELGAAVGLALLAAVSAAAVGPLTEGADIANLAAAYRVGYLTAAALMVLAVAAAVRLPGAVGRQEPAAGEEPPGLARLPQ